MVNPTSRLLGKQTPMGVQACSVSCEPERWNSRTVYTRIGLVDFSISAAPRVKGGVRPVEDFRDGGRRLATRTGRGETAGPACERRPTGGRRRPAGGRGRPPGA